MADADEEDAAEVRRLHEVLRQRHAELRRTTPGTPEHDRQLVLVFEATDGLVAHEEVIPQRHRQHRRRVFDTIVYAGCGLAGAAALVAVGLMAAGRIGWWYVVPAALVVATAAAVARTVGVPAAGTSDATVDGAHDVRRVAAAGLTAAAAGLLLAAGTELVPDWTVTILVAALALAVGLRSGLGEAA